MSDTSEITNGSLTHYDSSHIQTRRDFMGLCKYNRDEFAERRKQEPNQECMAKIVRLVETLTDHAKTEWKLKALRAAEKGLAKPKEPKRYPIELSNGVIIRLIYETFGESTVRNSLNYLEYMGYIGRKQEKKNAVPIYWLEREYVQALLKAQAEVILAGYEFRPPSYEGAISYPDGVISDPKSVNSRPGYAYAGSESTDNNIDKRDDITNRDGNREGEGVVANAPTAPAFPEPEYHFAGTEQQHLVWNCHTWCAVNRGTCEDYVSAIDAGLHDNPTDKVPVVPPGNVTPVTYSQPAYKQGDTDGHLSQPTCADVGSNAAERAMGGTEQGAFDGQLTPMQQTVSTVPLSQDGAASTAPPSSRPRASEVDKPQRGKRKSKEDAPLKCDPSEVQQRLNKRRGYALEERVAIIRERTAIKTWCALHTLVEFEQVMTQLQGHDPYWKKPENRYRITGNTLAVETPKILADLNGHAPPAPEKDYTGFDVYKGNGPEERAYYAAIGASLPDSYFDQ